MGILDSFTHIQQQGELGRARGKENRLASLSQQAYGAQGADRQSLLGQMEGTQFGSGVAMGDKLQSQEDSRHKKYVGAARYMLSAIEKGDTAAAQGAYLATMPAWQELANGQPIPPMYDETQKAQMLPMLHQIIAAGEGTGSDNGNNIQSTYVNAQGQRVGIRRDGTQITLGDANQSIRVLEQEGALPYGVVTSGGVAGQVVPLGGGQPAPIAAPTQAPAPNAPSGAQTVMGGAYDSSVPTPETFSGIATQFPGVQLTSTRRTPEHNAKVGGVPNSQHLAGTAGDFVVPQAQKAAFIAAMAARNPPLQAIDEGDHIHVQQPHGAQAAGQQAGGPVRTPTAGEKVADQEQAKIDTYLRNSGMTAQADAQAAAAKAAAEATAKGRAEAEVAAQYGTEESRKASREAQAKMPQLKNAVRGVGRIGNALKALDMPYINTGPLDQYAVRKTKAGQELETAVGAIQNSFLALTRVPGVGSQSDLEQRVAMLQYPSLDKDPEVNARTYENLQAFARDLEAAYNNVTQGGGQSPASQDRPAPGGWGIQRVGN